MVIIMSNLDFKTVALSSENFIGKTYIEHTTTVLDSSNTLANGTVLATLADNVTDDELNIASNAVVVGGMANDCITDVIRRAKFVDIIALCRKVVKTCKKLGVSELHQKRYITNIANIIKKERNALAPTAKRPGLFLPCESKSFMIKQKGLSFVHCDWTENSWVTKAIVDAELLNELKNNPQNENKNDNDDDDENAELSSGARLEIIYEHLAFLNADDLKKLKAKLID